MDKPIDVDRQALRIAERLIQLLDQGSFTATYKYAVLVALMDLCLELTGTGESPPNMVTTWQLAEKVLELYWPHCRPYGERGILLRQAHGRKETQAEIVTRISRFRERCGADQAASIPLSAARAAAGREAYDRLVRFVEWKLVEMPLTKLQVISGEEDQFLYRYTFPRDMKNMALLNKHHDEAPDDPTVFDNRLNLRDGVGAALVALNGVLRPLVHRQWAMMIAQMNGLEEAALEEFLFGAKRISLDPVRPRLRELQDGRCFYCSKSLVGAEYDVDHFIPWARHPDDGIHNLVATDKGCNNRKRDFLASAEHVEKWRERAIKQADDLVYIADMTSWLSSPTKTFNVARRIYKSLPDDARLWQRGDDFVKIERPRIDAALVA